MQLVAYILDVPQHKDIYWWNGMKKDVVEFISKYLTCQQVKVEHQKPTGKLQPLLIPEWKWERITKDFVTGYLDQRMDMIPFG